MNSSFPNRWSFSYLKFTKYVTNIIAEPKYKYGEQEQVTIRNHNRSTALELLTKGKVKISYGQQKIIVKLFIKLKASMPRHGIWLYQFLIIAYLFTLSSYDYSTLSRTTLSHHLIKDKLMDLNEQTLSREHALYLACNEERTFSLLMSTKITNSGFTETFVKSLLIFWKKYFIRLETKLYNCWGLIVLPLLQIC